MNRQDLMKTFSIDKLEATRLLWMTWWIALEYAIESSKDKNVRIQQFLYWRS